MVEVLSNLSDDLAEIVAKVGPGVVQVEGRSRAPASGIVWSEDGVVVTANHVVERDDEIRLGMPDGQTIPATLVGRDPTRDLAVLRAQDTRLTPVNWTEPDGSRVGHLVLALGRPGHNIRATQGIISALGKSWHTPAGGGVDRYLQTDVLMYPGFSGGPLVNAAGQGLGLNTSALIRGVSMTIPVPTLMQVVEMLLAHGRMRRGYLGVGAQPVRLPPGLSQQLDQEAGLLLVSVATGSPAEMQGLLLGDTIVSLGGQPVTGVDGLLALLGDDTIGQAVGIRVLRAGAILELTVTVGEHD